MKSVTQIWLQNSSTHRARQKSAVPAAICSLRANLSHKARCCCEPVLACSAWPAGSVRHEGPQGRPGTCAARSSSSVQRFQTSPGKTKPSVPAQGTVISKALLQQTRPLSHVPPTPRGPPGASESQWATLGSGRGTLLHRFRTQRTRTLFSTPLKG